MITKRWLKKIGKEKFTATHLKQYKAFRPLLRDTLYKVHIVINLK